MFIKQVLYVNRKHSIVMKQRSIIYQDLHTQFIYSRKQLNVFFLNK